MRAFGVVVVAALVLSMPGTAWADHRDPPPKHDDSGCCFQFDNSPVQVFFCNVQDACRVEPPK